MSVNHRSQRKKKGFHHQQFRPGCNYHHVYPRSRQRKNCNDAGKFKWFCGSLRLKKKVETHAAWHQLFANLFPEEVLSLIKSAFSMGKNSAPAIMSFIRTHYGTDRTRGNGSGDVMAAWHKIFGDNHCSLRKIKKIITNDWMYPGVKALVSNGKIAALLFYLPDLPDEAERLVYYIYRRRDIEIIPLKDEQLLKII